MVIITFVVLKITEKQVFNISKSILIGGNCVQSVKQTIKFILKITPKHEICLVSILSAQTETQVAISLLASLPGVLPTWNFN